LLALQVLGQIDCDARPGATTQSDQHGDLPSLWQVDVRGEFVVLGVGLVVECLPETALADDTRCEVEIFVYVLLFEPPVVLVHPVARGDARDRLLAQQVDCPAQVQVLGYQLVLDRDCSGSSLLRVAQLPLALGEALPNPLDALSVGVLLTLGRVDYCDSHRHWSRPRPQYL